PAAATSFCAGADLRAEFAPDEVQALDRAAAAAPYGQGNHWIATRGNRVVHVIGTMHLDDPRWPGVMEALSPVVAGADRLLVEMTVEEQDAMRDTLARDPARAFITEGPTLPEMLSDRDWTRLSAAMADRRVPAVIASRMQPWLLALMLGLPTCALRNPAPGEAGLDKRLMEVAAAAGVPVAGLEAFDDLHGLLTAGSPVEQLDLLMASLPMADRSDDQFATTAAIYFEENAGLAWEFARLQAMRGLDLPAERIEAVLADFEDRLLVQRNRAWMDTILTAPGDRIAVAVGALHLMGENGVLNLLDAAGYRLERAAFARP
ncbi:MAG: TraB/GumN family protein, partial [Proteobacteria bacterium]|nr:TraB/GumN family protein [Pseudomonadota bacterium]